jgi:hypothetical protein
LLEAYEALAFFYPGWGLEEIRMLSYRERNLWLEKGITRIKALRGE